MQGVLALVCGLAFVGGTVAYWLTSAALKDLPYEGEQAAKARQAGQDSKAPLKQA